ncbi:MAG: HNH endonuclease [Armatimonadetes bacterium]|nr:HNH endonuclease [Armatimonadota bacterium]
MSGEGGPALAASQIPFSCCHVEEERQERRYKRWWRRQVIEREMRDFECDCARMSELWTHLDWRVAHVHLESLDKACEHRTPDAIDAHLQEILKVERRFERHLLRMLERFKRNAFYMTLEYPSFQNYCQNRLGISPSLGLSLVALSGHLRRLPNLDAALQAGRVNRSQAELVSRVATPGTVDRWIAHASATTVRFLREDVRAAERMRAADPENFRRTGGFADLQTSSANVDHAHVSPSVAQTADLQTFSTDVEHAHVSPQTAGLLTFSAETIRRIGDVETPPPSIPDLLTLREQIQRMLRGRNDEEFLGKNSVPVRFKLPPDAVALWDDAWRAVSHLVGCHAGYDDVLDTIVDAFLSEHLREALESIRRHPLLDRRDWRCANPTCSRRSNLHGHHVKFRSRGGGDEDANIAYLCRACHLRGVHEGWITVSGEAPDGLTWILGARLEGGPHLVVSGRVVMQTPARHALSA